MHVPSLLVSALMSGSLALGPSPEPGPGRDGAWPLQPRPDIGRGFDPPSERFGAGHRGVDLVGRAGQPVHASLAGVVTFAATLAGRGVVVVDHGGIRTTYEPVTASVGVGTRVTRGAVVGRLQRASPHCFPRACLHWGLRRGETYLDPLTLVGAGPVRLLPIDWAAPSRPVPGGTTRAPTSAAGVPTQPWWRAVGSPRVTSPPRLVRSRSPFRAV